jgi:hypothetical protein
VVTDTLPLDPGPTNAVIFIEEDTKNALAGVPPKLTAVAPVKLVPLMVTDAFVLADVGVKEVIVGAWADSCPVRRKRTYPRKYFLNIAGIAG